MKLISVISPCYNEEGNVELLYSKVKDVFNGLNVYAYELIEVVPTSEIFVVGRKYHRP